MIVITSASSLAYKLKINSNEYMVVIDNNNINLFKLLDDESIPVLILQHESKNKFFNLNYCISAIYKQFMLNSILVDGIEKLKYDFAYYLNVFGKGNSIIPTYSDSDSPIYDGKIIFHPICFANGEFTHTQNKETIRLFKTYHTGHLKVVKSTLDDNFNKSNQTETYYYNKTGPITVEELNNL